MSRNDTNALNAFYQRVSHLAYGLALRIVGDEQTAQNLVRDAFLKLWQQAPAYTQGGARAQLLATIHRSACDGAQHKPNAAGTGTDLSPVLTLERESAERVLIDLADDERTAIELAYYTGRNRTEIATQLALSLDTITRLVSSGMTTLRTHNQANAQTNE